MTTLITSEVGAMSTLKTDRVDVTNPRSGFVCVYYFTIGYCERSETIQSKLWSTLRRSRLLKKKSTLDAIATLTHARVLRRTLQCVSFLVQQLKQHVICGFHRGLVVL